jgi:hypothetical protein
MTWFYLLESIPNKMETKPPPLFSIFLAIVRTNSRDSHWAMSEEEEGGYCVQLLIYRHNSDVHSDIIMPITTKKQSSDGG